MGRPVGLVPRLDVPGRPVAARFTPYNPLARREPPQPVLLDETPMAGPLRELPTQIPLQIIRAKAVGEGRFARDAAGAHQVGEKFLAQATAPEPPSVAVKEQSLLIRAQFLL